MQRGMLFAMAIGIALARAASARLTALQPDAAIDLNGAPAGSADPDGSATVNVPVGAHTITVLPEPSTLVGLAAGALLAVFLTRRSRD